MAEPLLRIGAAYIRVSDERQDEYSPDSQLKKIREYAAKEGYQIPDDYVFYDDGISGKSTRKRGEFNLMIAAAKEKNHCRITCTSPAHERTGLFWLPMRTRFGTAHTVEYFPGNGLFGLRTAYFTVRPQNAELEQMTGRAVPCVGP
jgi:hypothetical protein